MAIPLILGIGAGISALAGIAAGVGAKGNFDTAKSIAKKAKGKYEEKKDGLNREERETKTIIQNCGQLKVDTYQRVMRDTFLPAYKKFKKNYDINHLKTDSAFTAGEVQNIEKNIDIAEKIASGAIGGLFAGGMGGAGAAAGAWALAGAVGTASTGTAIGTLSGAAASSAAMAWLGGGALTAGGLGMAGGAVLLGGLVAGPVIAITGFAMASKADKALTDAYRFSDDVDKACAEMQRYITHYKALQARCDELTGLVEKLSRVLQEKVSQLNLITKKKKGLFKKKKLSEKEEHNVEAAFKYAKVLESILNTPIVNEKGNITPDIEKAIEKAKDIT